MLVFLSLHKCGLWFREKLDSGIGAGKFGKSDRIPPQFDQPLWFAVNRPFSRGWEIIEPTAQEIFHIIFR